MNERRSDRDIAPAGPEVGIQPTFETGDGCRVGPGLAAEDSAEGGVLDSTNSRNFSHAEFVGVDLNSKNQLAEGLDDRILASAVGPALTGVSGSGSSGASHESTVAVKPDLRLVLSSAAGTLSAEAYDSKQQAEDIKRLIDNYRPHKMSAKTWAKIEDTVKDIVRASDPNTYEFANTLNGAVAYLTEWAYKTGQSLNPLDLLDVGTIERYIKEGCPNLSTNSRSTRRSALFRVAEQVLGPTAITAKRHRTDVDSPLGPYTDTEMSQFRLWARMQTNANRTRSTKAMLGLCAGAGLSASDLLTVRAGDIRRMKSLLVVEIGGKRARLVPILPEFESFVLDAKNGLTKDQFVFLTGRKRRERCQPTNFVKQCTGDKKPTFQRLRVTWLIHWIEHGLPLDVLLRVSGVKELHGLSRYMRFVTTPTNADVINTFRELS